MAVIASWSGTGLADGTPVTTATVGTGDTPWNDVTAGAFTVSETGLHPPRLQCDQPPTDDANLIWTTATLGTLAGHCVRMYLELSAYPPANARIVGAHDSTAALEWFLQVTTDGLLRLRNLAGIVDTSAAVLPLDTELRIEVVADGAGAADVYVYEGDSTTPWDVLSGTGFGTTVQQMRVINPQASPVWPRLWVGSIAVSDTAELIGPVPAAPVVPSTVAPEVPVFLPGVPVATVPAEFNAKIRDPFTALLAPAGFIARNTAGQTITENTVQAIEFDQIDEDTYAGWDDANPSQWVVPDGWAGWWHATAAVSLSGTGASGLVLIPSIAVNSGLSNIGVIYEGQEVFVPTGNSSQPKTVSSAWWVYAAPGDVVELLLYFSDESGITSVDTGAGLQCRLEIYWDGA